MRKKIGKFIPLIAVVTVLGIALLLQDFARQAVIVPLSYLWFWLTLTYRSLPQSVYWILLATLVLMMALGSLYKGRREQASPDDTSVPLRGEIEHLAWWLSQQHRGSYFRWRVANRLGGLAASILADHGYTDRKQAVLWQPPEHIEHYLQFGLAYESVTPTPFLDAIFRKFRHTSHAEVEDVVTYLETYQEVQNGK